MKNNLPNKYRRKQYIALTLLGLAIAISQLIFYFYRENNKPDIPEVKFIKAGSSEYSPAILAEFNPNDLDESQWKNLGFSEKEVATILKYKKIIGGEFKSKEQFKKCYPIVNRYAELEPYILLPETNKDAAKSTFTPKIYEKKRLNIPGKFNPDRLSVADWVAMGFSEKQAEAILKYKRFLGGSFQSKEKLRACYMINSNQYAQMAPYILLPEYTAEVQNTHTSNPKENTKINYSYFDPNELNENGWKSLGFTDRQVTGIMNYKHKILKGSFRSLEDVQKCYMITQRFDELKPWIRFNPATIKESEKPTYSRTETKPDSKTDFSKLNLNDITFNQLREFGFNEKTAGGFVSFRKNLGGFVNKNQIFEVYGIDRELAEKLVSTAELNASDVKKYTLVDAPETWLKTHPYFKYSADKIIFYRISDPDEKKIWKFIKAKPEYEAKMRLYLK